METHDILAKYPPKLTTKEVENLNRLLCKRMKEKATQKANRLSGFIAGFFFGLSMNCINNLNYKIRGKFTCSFIEVIIILIKTLI